MTVMRLGRFPAPVAAAALLALVAFLVVGISGVRAYVDNYVQYRGFPPPVEPAFVKQPGTLQRLLVPSPALGGRAQEAYVYLPPGYATSPRRRYPVLYLLHGFPGRPLAFMKTVQMGIVEDSLTAKHRAQPLILVMPFGSTGTFTDKEWVDGVSPHDGWATFVARDLVNAIDARYRTIRARSSRGIGGLSEGGYGAVNIALHHPGEFSVIESWSGYMRPDPIRSIFGRNLELLNANDPRRLLPRVAPELRRRGTFFWIYSGSKDRLEPQNAAFAQELARFHVPYRYTVVHGGHNWGLWRRQATAAYLAAASRLVSGG